eukprot:CAMPEP_0116874810 /NCGR_PEP_ID=MMETSP0463-20121206/6400_1 /TAXON_ID=181622 /ORGANISM="Strombidinopsis sp, Strain SopsisLIS2011" /LENGTH=72 /DNA_ID=CAMNT_0004519083 /DNA_START=3680 /DNA_END=3898 /DNA_ORIENTATION=+
MSRGYAYSTEGGHAPELVRRTTIAFRRTLKKAQDENTLLNSEQKNTKIQIDDDGLDDYSVGTFSDTESDYID